MLKPTTTTIFFISCIVLLGLSSLVHAQGYPEDLKWCSKKDNFVGHDCGSDGNYQCLLDFLGRFGASSMPKNCRCQNLGHNQRTCGCQVVCHQSENSVLN